MNASAFVGGKPAGAVAASIESLDRDGERDHAGVLAAYAADRETTRAAYLLYLVANVGPRVATLVLLVVLTRVLPADEYGLFALVVTAGEILDTASTGWIRIYLLRTEGGAATLRPRPLGRALGLNAGATAVALALAVLAVPLINRERQDDLLVCAIAYILAFALLRLALTLAQLARRHGIYVAIEIVRGAAVIVVIVVAILAGAHSFLPVSLAVSFAAALSAVIGFLLVARHIPRPAFPRRGYLEPLAFGVPFVLAATLVYMIGWSDRFILNYYVGHASVAVYVAAYSISRHPVDFFIVALNNFTFPLLMRAYAAGGAREAGPVQTGVTTTIAVVGIAIVAGLSVLAGPLATVLFPPSYREPVTMLLPWIAGGTFLLSLKQFVFDNTLHVTRQTWVHFISMLPPALISVVLGIVLIRTQGLFGSAINFGLVSVVALIVSVYFSLRIFTFEIPYRQIGKVLFSAALATAATWAVRNYVAPWGAVAVVATGLPAFAIVYAGALTICGISVRRLIETPWAPVA